ncbi:hypothetical protein MASR2M39_31890 [Ignavibacteriales bacterium]
MTIKDFGRQIKTKYPQYETFTDEEIGNKMLQKYPQYQKQISQPNKGILEKTSDVVGNALDKTNNMLFGSTSKAVGSLLGSAAESARNLAVSPEKQTTIFTDNTGMPKYTPTATDVIFTGLELYPGGGTISKTLKKMPGGKAIAEAFMKIPEGLRESAIKQYSEALGATTKELKATTAKVTPSLLDRNITGSLPKLKQVAQAGIESAGSAIKKAEDLIPSFKQQSIKPIITKAVNLRNSFLVNGKVLDTAAVSSIDNVIESVAQFGDKIPETQLLKVRRILDKSVALSNKNFTKEEGLSLATEAKAGIANTIRNILNTSNPKLGKANSEFNLWSNLNKVVSNTVERKSTQSNGIT